MSWLVSIVPYAPVVGGWASFISLAVYVVRKVLIGDLVPRSRLRDEIDRAEKLEKAVELHDARADEAMRLVGVMTQQLSTVEALIRSLPPPRTGVRR